MAVSTAASTTYDVYVGNLPTNYNETQIRDIFDVAGDIAGVKIIPGKPGIPGRVAFVKFVKEADAQCVAQYMSNFQLADGRNLTVNYRPHQKSTSTSSNPLLKVHVNNTGKVDEPIVNGVDKKVDETLVLYVSDVASPLEFSAHLYNKELAAKLDKLTRSMESVCPLQPKVVGQLSMDDMVYGCKFSLDEMWYRCRIQKCLPKNEIEVRYIDYGNSEVINRFALVKLPIELVNLPPLCDHYLLDDLELVDRDVTSELYMKGLALFSTIIGEQRVEVKVVKKEASRTRVKLMKLLDSPYSENFRDKMMTTGAVKMKMVGKSPLLKTLKSPTSVKSPTVAKSPATLKSLSPSAVITPISVKSPAKVTLPPPTPTKENTTVPSNPPSEKSSSPITVLPDKEEVSAPESDALQVYVSHIESPLEFWGQIFNTELEVKLLTLTATLEDICPSQRKIMPSDQPDLIYGCQFSQDGLWYRCKIEETINNTQVHVRYVDYGNSEITCKSGLVVLPPDISSLEGLCKQYKVGGLELASKETTSETFRQGIHALQVLIGEQKVQLHELKIEYGTHIVHIDKVADVPVDVNAELIAKGVVCAKNVDRNVKSKPPKVKRMIFTADDVDDVEDTQSLPVIVADTKSNAKGAPGNGQATYADKMLKKMSTKVKSIKPTISTESITTPMVNGDEAPTELVEEDTKAEMQSLLAKEDNTHATVIDYRLSSKIDDKAELSPTPHSNEKTLDKYVKEIEEKRKEVEELQKQLVAKTLPPTVDATSSTDIATRAVETNTVNMAKKDAETNTLPALPKCVEMNMSSSTSTSGTNDTTSSDGSMDKKLKEIEKEIEKKRKEVEELKEKLSEKTKLVDDYLKKIPTPGCKRDLYQLYDDDAYENDEDVSKSNVQVMREEKLSLNDIGGYKKEISELRELIEAPLLHRELFEDVGVKPSHGVLVSGPRGSGKTVIARAVASEVKAFLVELHGPSLMGRPIKELQKILTDAFREAENNPPAIIFIDELDKIAPKKVTDKSTIIVSQILRLWNTLKKKKHCVLLATLNGDIDPSLMGYGLFERDIKISVPNTQKRLGILSMLTKNMNLHADVSLKNIADQTGGYVASDLASLCNVAGMQVICRKMSNMHIKKDEGFLFDKSCTSSTGAFQSSISVTVWMQDFKHALSLTKPSVPKIYEIPDISWEHIGGLLDVKSDLQNFVKYSTEYSSKFKQYGICPPKGVLLHGPQGCGKRTLAKAFANQCRYNFINVDGCELLGVLTNDARRNEFSAKIENAMPCVVFIKNIDNITEGRGYKFREFFSTMDNLVLKNDMFVIGSATSIEDVHPSFKIEGRLDHAVHVPLPDEDSRTAILEMKLNKISKCEEINVNEIAKSTQGLCGRELLEICDKVCKCAIMDSIDSHRYKKEQDDKGKMCGTPRLTMEHFSRILELAEEKTTSSEDRSCVHKDALPNDVTLNSQTDTSLYLARVIEKMLAEKSIKDAMKEISTETDYVFEACEDGNETLADGNGSQVMLNSQTDTSLYLTQFMENRIRERIIKDAMRETTSEMNDMVEVCEGEMNNIATEVEIEVCEEENEILVEENEAEGTTDIEEVGLYDESNEPVNKMTQEEGTTDIEEVGLYDESKEPVNKMTQEEEGDIEVMSHNDSEVPVCVMMHLQETVSNESQETVSELKQYEGTSYVEVAINNESEEPICEMVQPKELELSDVVVSNYVEVETHKESEEPVCDRNEPEVLQEITSDSEKDILNESFESCDSNLDGATLDDEDIVQLSKDCADISKESHDDPNFEEGHELEGWNAALLNKKTREPDDIPFVDYEDGKEGFF